MAASANVDNYLLVGSDSRAQGDPNTGDGSADIGQRSDTIMVLRYDKASGDASLLSIPRDLWVDIPGRGNQRVNAAYNDGPAVPAAGVNREARNGHQGRDYRRKPDFAHVCILNRIRKGGKVHDSPAARGRRGLNCYRL